MICKINLLKREVILFNFRNVLILISFAIFAFYAALFFAMFSFFSSDAFIKLFESERFIFSVKLSVFTAFISAALSVVIAVPVGYSLSRYEFKFKWLIDSILELPLIISPVALGAILLIFFNTRAGVLIQNNFMQFVFETGGIVLAQFVTTAGLAVRSMKTVFDEIPKRYEAVARTLGASPLKAFYTVALPLAWRGIMSAFVLSFAKSVGEFGATITLAGSMPMKTETLPVAIYLRLSNADIESTVALIFILFAIGACILAFLKKIAAVKAYD